MYTSTYLIPNFVAKLPIFPALSPNCHRDSAVPDYVRRRAPPPFVLLDAVASWQGDVKRPEQQTDRVGKRWQQ